MTQRKKADGGGTWERESIERTNRMTRAQTKNV